MISKFLVPQDDWGNFKELFRCDLCSQFVEEIHIESDWGFCHDCYAINKMFQDRRKNV